MKPTRSVLLIAVCLATVFAVSTVASADGFWGWWKHRDYERVKPRKKPKKRINVQLGPRPYYLVNDMDPGPLKDDLLECREGPFRRTDFSIGHRGAPVQFPEHTKESYEAAARMGAGILECDVTFTSDFELVCRHSQCDLHTTTNILATPLAEKCSEPFVPADPEAGTPASALCCTSDITLAEYKTLCGKMDASDPTATTVEEYLGGTARWRTDLYSSCGTLLSHAESIDLIYDLGGKFTPELKGPSVEMPFTADDGMEYTQEDYAQKMIDEYKEAGIRPRDVWAQSFNLNDVLYWINYTPRFGRQAVFLESAYYNGRDANDPSTWVRENDEDLYRMPDELRELGVRWFAPPMQNLIAADGELIVPSALAHAARSARLRIIAWTIERSNPLSGAFGSPGFYYSSVLDNVNNDGDLYEVLDVLAFDVGIRGIFTDWPATVTYYANCMGL